MPRQTKKYVAAAQMVKMLSDGSKALVKRNMSHEDLYSVLDQAGYWWDSSKGDWQKRESIHQGPNGRYRLESGVYKIRITAHERDIHQVCRQIAAQHRVAEMSDPYPNDRDGTPEIVRVYFTCVLESEDKS